MAVDDVRSPAAGLGRRGPRQPEHEPGQQQGVERRAQATVAGASVDQHLPSVGSVPHATDGHAGHLMATGQAPVVRCHHDRLPAGGRLAPHEVGQERGDDIDVGSRERRGHVQDPERHGGSVPAPSIRPRTTETGLSAGSFVRGRPAYHLGVMDTAELDVTRRAPRLQRAGHLLAEIDRIRAALDASPYTYEIIVVDDGSTDGSGDQLQAVEGIRLIRFPDEPGLGLGPQGGHAAPPGAGSSCGPTPT